MLTQTLAIRPYFWNVPLWAQIGLYVLGIAAMGIFIAGVIRSFRQRTESLETQETDTVLKGWRELLRIVFTQRKICETPSGKAHFAIFWGCTLLFLGTALATIDWDVTWLLFDFRILKGDFYLFYKFVLDIAGLGALLGLTWAFFRRFILDDPKVEPTGRSGIILGSLATIIMMGFGVEALRLAIETPPWAKCSPIGYALSLLLAGMSQDSLRSLHLFFWVVHALTALSFIAVIPLTFYAHLFKTPASIRRTRLTPVGSLTPIRDIENQEHFGLGQYEQMRLSDRIHVEGCTECGRCRSVCPAYAAGAPLDPKSLVLSLQKRVDGEMQDKPLVGGIVSPEVLWSCTTCQACATVCPAQISIPDLIVEMRRHLALECGDFPQGLAHALEHTTNLGNPWALDPASRLSWAKDLDVPVAKPGVHYDVLYWVGCSASYDKRAQKIARSMVKLFRVAKVDFSVLDNERCHAEWARKTGEEYLFQQAAQENIEHLRAIDFTELVCACPHCFNTFRHEYPQFEGGTFRVTSHVDFLNRLLQENRLALSRKSSEQSVTLHDACYLARVNQQTQQPRDLLAASGLDLKESAPNGSATHCCGAGGGQLFIDQKARINVIRIHELKASGASCIATECPHCLTMLNAAREPDDPEILDIAEILAKRLDSKDE